jgi:hypothetical protein
MLSIKPIKTVQDAVDYFYKLDNYYTKNSENAELDAILVGSRCKISAIIG